MGDQEEQTKPSPRQRPMAGQGFRSGWRVRQDRGNSCHPGWWFWKRPAGSSVHMASYPADRLRANPEASEGSIRLAASIVNPLVAIKNDFVVTIKTNPLLVPQIWG